MNDNDNDNDVFGLCRCFLGKNRETGQVSVISSTCLTLEAF